MLNILESDGVRSLHFGSLAVQGAMRIDRPHDIELEYVQQMMMWLLFRNEVAHIVQLGLGAAALTKFYHRRLPPASTTAVELDSDFEPLYARAEQIRATLGLPAKSWVDGLYAWMNQGMEHG